MLATTTIGGELRARGEVLEISDPRLIDALLRDRIAEPADGRGPWRQERRRPWIMRWRQN